ncbi:nucleotide exchange factor GrpE [Campylobacter sp. 19-13652]|uniref:nucleotide exchange factor GrpE n=1 Tax=Campylobacter sp. 19-13652 TaxID=2840180 RepID=UPI001C798FB4|nr:protein GrpE [Campylobacter sp. 19-13652]
MNEEINSEQAEISSEQAQTQNSDESINLDALKSNDKALELESKLAEMTDKFYRANADFENLKKRTEKEKADIASYANEKFARDLLGVLDALQMGASFEPADEFGAKIKEGIELSIAEFIKALAKHGVSEVEVGGEFDPNIHNAVMHVDSDEHESGAIVQVLQKGYKINDRVLRPAMVSIAK